MLRHLLIPAAVSVGLVFAVQAQEGVDATATEAPPPEPLAAEPPPPAPEPPPVASETPPLPAPEDFVEDVPDKEKAARSNEYLARMKEILSGVLKHLADAREERDVVKLNCVNEKLTAIKGLLKISEQADVAMQEALARRNSEIADHEYEKIAIAASKCEQLYAESEACVGELAVYSGDTEITVEIEGEPPEDLSENIEPVELITRPPAASPYQ